MPALTPEDLVERERRAQRDGLVRLDDQPAIGRRIQSAPGATVASACELAFAGDYSMIAARLRAGRASPEEQKLAADILTGEIKPQRKKISHLVADDRRRLVAEFIRESERENPGVKRESLIKEAMDRFDVPRSEVFTSLKLFESK